MVESVHTFLAHTENSYIEKVRQRLKILSTIDRRLDTIMCI